MDKQWGPSEQHRELYPVSWDRTWWKKIWEKNEKYIYTHIHLTGVIMLYSRNWLNTVNQQNFNKNWKKIRRAILRPFPKTSHLECWPKVNQIKKNTDPSWFCPSLPDPSWFCPSLPEPTPLIVFYKVWCNDHLLYKHFKHLLKMWTARPFLVNEAESTSSPGDSNAN